ncbi:UPF0182 protein [Anopheles sinensis]|uniref:UPF0182 protein n=1 Tax=Anopheles sinensis TaxID=74873 RepID=A0A084WFJ1_ANOSI|nr:UPF0182 protein [Anopheles sinensis]
MRILLPWDRPDRPLPKAEPRFPSLRPGIRNPDEKQQHPARWAFLFVRSFRLVPNGKDSRSKVLAILGGLAGTPASRRLVRGNTEQVCVLKIVGSGAFGSVRR